MIYKEKFTLGSSPGQWVEPAPNVYNFVELDYQVKRAGRRGKRDNGGWSSAATLAGGRAGMGEKLMLKSATLRNYAIWKGDCSLSE